MKIHMLDHTSPGQVGGIGYHAEHIRQLLQKDHEVVETNLEDGQIENTALDADMHLAITIFVNLDVFRQIEFLNKKVGYMFAEYTDYPPEYLALLQPLDELWTTTKWHRDVFKKFFSGPIHVVPEGVDPDLFNMNIEPERSVHNLSGFKFLCVARPYTRKNIPTLVKAFLKEFEGEDVKLLLAMGVNDLFPEFKHKQIINVRPTAYHATWAKLYRSCHAFVLPTRGEGWGLPICEAMACGLPVITTLYSGVTEYANEDVVYPINYKMVDVSSTNVPNFDGIIREAHQGLGDWADPDPDHLRFQMRHVFNNYEEAKEKGKKASKHILGNFTWDHTGEILRKILA